MITRSRRRGPIVRLADSFIQRYRYHRWRLNLRKHLADLDAVPLREPVFLLGTQGGGLTILSRYIRRHPPAVSVTGSSRYWTGSDEMQNVLADRLPDRLRLRGHPALERAGLQESWRYATDRLLPHFREMPDEASEEIRQQFVSAIREILLLYGRGEPGLRFVDKSQSYTVKAGFVAELLEGHRPKFLLVTRNPYALCKRAADKVLTETGLSYRDRLRAAGEHWRNSVQAAVEDGEAMESFGVVRLEDFLDDPEETVEEIAGYIDMDLRTDLLPSADDRVPVGTPADGKWYPLRPHVNRKYLESLSERSADVIRRRCGELADQFGYTAEGP